VGVVTGACVMVGSRFNKDYLNIVADDLHERAFMIQSAPYMTRPVMTWCCASMT
jgi:hypothetical protein